MTYQSVHWEDEGEVETDSQTQERGHNTDRGRGRGRGPPRGYRRNNRQHRRSSAYAVKDRYVDNEEMGFIFKVQGVDNVLSTPRNASVHQRPLTNDSTRVNNKISAPRLSVDAFRHVRNPLIQ